MSYCQKFPLVFFDKGEKVDGALLQERVLEPILDEMPWADRLSPRTRWWWDGAGPNTSGRIQQWLRNDFPNFIDKSSYPPSSPDLMPQDFFLHAQPERDIKPSDRTTKDKFKAALIREWNKIPMSEVRAAIDQLPDRLRACVRAKGGYFEQYLR